VTVSKIIAVSVLCVGVALVACRREERYEPLKLGADAGVQQQAGSR
jgi:hypothetical protein